MWLGLLIREGPDGDADLATLCAWAHDREVAVRVTGPPGALPESARLLRSMQGFGASFALPRCPHCREPLDVPDIDAAEASHERAA